MARYLDPKNDLPFMRIFGEHLDLLQSFLNALMPLEKDQQIAGKGFWKSYAQTLNNEADAGCLFPVKFSGALKSPENILQIFTAI
jgi:hypothetical protein